MRASYLFNTTIAGIEQADACLIVGANPRKEAALVNARLRKRWLMGGFEVGVVGPQIDLTYPSTYLGAGPRTLQEIADGSHAFADVLKRAERPIIIVGAGALARDDGAAVLALVRQIAETSGAAGDDWNGVNILHVAASRVGGLDIGFAPGEGGRDTAGILAGAEDGAVEVVYLLGADGPGLERLGETFVIYQGHHGDSGAQIADVILPGAAYTEKDATYVNMEGRPQQAARAVFPPGEAREDWKIIRALSGAMGAALPMNTIDDVRARMFEVAPHLAASDEIVAASWQAFGAAGALSDAPFAAAVENFYRTCPISRSSPTMAQCTEAFVDTSGEATGTDG